MFPHARRRRIGATIAGLAAVSLLVGGCSGGSDDSSAKDDLEASTLVAYAGQAGDYQVNFNPFSTTYVGGPGTIFESLFFFNQVKVSDPVPVLGLDYSWNKDGTRLSIALRQNVLWSDGERFTADDVIFTFDLMTRFPALNTVGYTGRAVAVDDSHVEIAFSAPAFTDAPQLLGKTYIVPKHVWKNIKDPVADVVAEPVGTGPFVLGRFTAKAITLNANAKYWAGEPAVRRVRYVALSGNQAAADALSTKKIDWQTGPVPNLANFEKMYSGYKSITVPVNQTALFTCSNSAMGCQGPQTDVAVRRAIYYAIDRAQVNSVAFQDTSSEISPGFALRPRDESMTSTDLTEEVAPMRANVRKATTLLEGAGWKKAKDGIYAKDGRRLSLTVRVVTGWTDYITALDTMTQQLKKAGIEIKIRQSSWNEWSDVRSKGQYELLIDTLYGGATADPFYLYEYFFDSINTKPVGTSANPNFARYRNDKVDKALAALKKISSSDTSARQPHFDTIQVQIEKDMPYIPVLTAGTTSEYNDTKFEGWPQADDLYAFPAVWSRPDDAQIFTHLQPKKKKS
jgi:peptide/nickel transport system substrate-binding protein